MQGLRRCRRDSWGENLVANTYPWLSPSNDSSAGQRLESRKDGRRANVAGAFGASVAIDGHVVIIDDVVTTGATVNALARCLKKAGAYRVDVWAIARTP